MVLGEKKKTSSPIEPLRCKLCGGQLDNNLNCRHCGTGHQRIQKLVVSKEYLTPEQRIAYDNYLVSMQSPKTRQEQSALDRHIGYGGSKRPVSMENPGTTTKEYRQALKDKIAYLKGGKKLSEQYYKKYGKLENMPPKKRKALEDFLNTTGGKIVSFKAHGKKVQFLKGAKFGDQSYQYSAQQGQPIIINVPANQQQQDKSGGLGGIIKGAASALPMLLPLLGAKEEKSKKRRKIKNE